MCASVTTRSSWNRNTTELYATYRSIIYEQALGVLHDPADSEDATQEVLLRIFRFLPRFQHRSTFSTWVHRITYNVCMNLIAQRRRSRLSRRSRHAETDPVSPEALVEDRATRALLLQAIAELPAMYQRPLSLHYLSDLSIEEIARRTGLPTNTVKIRIHRARRLLRRSLERPAESRVVPAYLSSRRPASAMAAAGAGR